MPKAIAEAGVTAVTEDQRKPVRHRTNSEGDDVKLPS